jgi:hypothetical protein
MSSFNGPLRVCSENRRYFTDDSGRGIYLTGSHTWASLKDLGKSDPPAPFDYDAYLDLLQDRHHNFMRMWTWELASYSYDGEETYSTPHPWMRCGPGTALDGKPKFDLTRFDDAYFERLRQRVSASAERGIYVSVMLFEGHGLHASLEPWCRDGHPFCRENNVNGIDGDPDDTGRVLDCHTLKMEAVTAIQEAYVEKVIDTVNDLDSVLYEISNETGAYSTEWQSHLIDFIHAREREKPKQHPVGMTFQFAGRDPGSNQALFESPADWISPNPEGGYRDDPPDGEGGKVILSDTDHLWGLGCAPGWVWKSFTRGMNPILMDPIQPFPGISEHPNWGPINDPDHPLWEPIRRQMGDTRRFAERVDLVRMVPRGDLASSGYCLANSGVEYLVYLPGEGTVSVDLSAASGSLDLEWFDVESGETVEVGRASGGSNQEFASPVGGEAALYLVACRD